MQELVKLISEQGSGAVSMAVVVWLVVYMAKKIIDGLGRAIDKLQDKMEKHETLANERARYVREEHQEMIKTLGRINGYKP